MKIYSLKSGVDIESLSSNYGQATEGITGEPTNAKLVGEIVDNDLFLCDLGSLEGFFIREISKNKHHIKNRIANGGVLLCFAGKLQTSIGDKHGGNNYTWLKELGADITPEDLFGYDFEFQGEEKFINLLNSRVDEFQHQVIFNSVPSGIHKSIGTNKAGHHIATYARSNLGHIFILPMPEDKNSFTEFFIEKILPTLDIKFEIDSGSKEPMPPEISKLVVTGQAELRKQIQTQREKINKEKEKLDQLNDKDNELEKWKDLLWQTGKPLEKTIKDFFRLLGLELDNVDPSGTDLVGEFQGNEVLVEVKGKTGCIDHKKDFRQIQERKHYDAENPDTAIALLIGNSFRLKPLSERPPKDQSLFAKTSLGLAKNNKIGLIPTTELFKIVNAILDKKGNKQQILKSILECYGLYSCTPNK